jgi:lysophospholipase L1-like esterase
MGHMSPGRCWFLPLLVLVGCSSSGDEIYIVGDSITERSSEELEARFADDDVAIRAAIGLDIFTAAPSIKEGVEADPDHLIIALGTNNDPWTESDDQALAAAIELIQDADAIWVTPNTNPEPIVEALRDHDIDAARWDLYSAGHPEWFADPVHPNAEGAKAFAEFIAASIE